MDTIDKTTLKTELKRAIDIAEDTKFILNVTWLNIRKGGKADEGLIFRAREGIDLLKTFLEILDESDVIGK